MSQLRDTKSDDFDPRRRPVLTPPGSTQEFVKVSIPENFCDPDAFKIDSVFSDFSLRDMGHEGRLAKQIQEWIESRRLIYKICLQFVAFVACLAVARAGGPAAYDIATASGDLSSVGFSQESTQKGYAGQNVISSYSRAEDSAHSSVRVSSHSISNDALLNYDVHHAPIVKAAVAAPTYLAPSAQPLIAKAYASPYSYAASAPLFTKAYASPYSYAASAPLIAKTYAAPAAPLLTKAYAAPIAAPLLTKAYAAPAPLLTKAYAAPAPLLAKSFEYAASAPIYSKSYEYAAQAPFIAKSALIAQAPAYATSYASSPLLAKSYSAAIAPAPLLTKTYASYAPAPLIAKSYAAPFDYAPQAQLISKSYAAPFVHTEFSGLGAHYSW
ncbi:uncharacterized protein LOC144470902 [Augochlora pura]